jgi:diguanylate cyclase (GGDEF)-like protein
VRTPVIPLDETVRLVSLHSLRLLDSAPEDRFDRITRMAKRLFDVEICLVSLVDSDRQWFKSRQGLGACETSREISFCGHAILEEQAFVVEDALLDLGFADNPLVADEPHIRFYAGYPVHSPNGQRVGTLCLIDRQPRTFSDKDREMLKDFASLVDDELASSSQINVDDMTKIANRRGFTMVADHLLPLCERNGLQAELLFFDLDGFKAINDNHGHEAGDRALRYFAKLLLKSFRKADVIARLGGDEFVVMVIGHAISADRSIEQMSRLVAESASPVERLVRWSVGRTQYDPETHGDVEALLSDADREMYSDKMNRKQCQAG